MALTYFGGEALLNYLYNDNNESLDGYDSFEIQLVDNNSAGYAGGRQSVVRGDDATFGNAWNIDGNIVTNKNDIQFPPLFSNAPAQTITKFNVFVDGISATKKAFASGTLNTPIVVQPGETPIIRAYNASSGDGLEIDIDETNKYTSAFRDKIYRYLFLDEDSLTNVAEYQFIVYDTSGNPTPLEFYLTRTSSEPNFVITSEGGGSYAAARNASDIDFDLNQGVNISTNQIRMFYSQGTFPNFTYVYAGDFIMREIGTGTPTTYTIANGETARLRTNFLRINAQ